MKKVVSILVAIAMLSMLLAGCTQNTGSSGKKVVIGMVTDTGGLGDNSFNDSAWDGITKAVEDSKGKADKKIVESKQAENYQPNLTEMAEAKVDLTFAVGYLFEEAMKTVADQYKDSKFGIIDTVVDKPNVASVTFKEHEGSFLVGVIAAKTTKTKTVGFVGGMSGDLIGKFEAGFKAGVKAVDPSIKVLTNYTEAFDSPTKGKEAAMSQFNAGADVIYHASGACGDGVIAAAKEKGLWAIGVDKDQSDLAPKNVLCSMLKRVDTGTYTVSKSVIDGTFKGGTVTVLGLKEDGVGYSDKAGNASKEAKELADKWAKAIKDGKVTVPEKADDVKNWAVPKI